MTRYCAQLHRSGFPDLYHVAEVIDGQWVQVGEPKPYHEANDEAGERNAGTWGKPEEVVLDFNALTGWLPGTNIGG